MTILGKLLPSGLCALLLAISSFPANSAIVINNTRVIYPQQEKEVTVQINNQGKGPVLLQSWIDDGDSKASPDTLKVPFMLTPPVNRVDADKSQTVRIRYTGDVLPSDRESLFWFNALEIPTKVSANADESNNYLQMAFRTRIKMFFRPPALKGDPEEAAKSLRWIASGRQITAVNDSPWHISLVKMSVTVNGKKQAIEGDTVSPFSKRSFSANSVSQGSAITWRYVNDYGAVHAVEGKLGR